MTARPLAELTLAPAAPASASSTYERRERLRVARCREEAGGAEQAEREHDALAEAVRGEPPREQRQGRAEPGRREHDADLAEREADSSRRAGAMTASPKVIAEKLVCESVPAASTAHRYRPIATARRG